MPTTELLLISKLVKLIILQEVINTEYVYTNISVLYQAWHSYQTEFESAKYLKSHDSAFEKWAHCCYGTFIGHLRVLSCAQSWGGTQTAKKITQACASQVTDVQSR